MKIEVRIDTDYTEPKVVILTNRMTQEVEWVVQKLTKEQLGKIAAYQDDMVEILDPDDVITFTAESGKVMARCAKKQYVIRLRLYELEERLDAQKFFRISHSEIINLDKVKRFDLSFAGTIRVEFKDGSTTFASRRYVSAVKKALGM